MNTYNDNPNDNYWFLEWERDQIIDGMKEYREKLKKQTENE